MVGEGVVEVAKEQLFVLAAAVPLFPKDVPTTASRNEGGKISQEEYMQVIKLHLAFTSSLELVTQTK